MDKALEFLDVDFRPSGDLRPVPRSYCQSQSATEVGLGKHLYAWDGSKLRVLFRSDASERTIGFNRTSGMRDVLNCRPILAAAAVSLPAHEHA